MQCFIISPIPRTGVRSENIEHFDLPVINITPHSARRGSEFLAHQKGHQAQQIALIGRWKSADSLARYINNAKTQLAYL